METKVCCTCKVPKELSAFYRNRQRKDGLNPQCKKCQDASQKARMAQSIQATLSSGRKPRKVKLHVVFNVKELEELQVLMGDTERKTSVLIRAAVRYTLIELSGKKSLLPPLARFNQIIQEELSLNWVRESFECQDQSR